MPKGKLRNLRSKSVHALPPPARAAALVHRVLNAGLYRRPIIIRRFIQLSRRRFRGLCRMIGIINPRLLIARILWHTKVVDIIDVLMTG
jgi:hypothetical protein